MINRVLPDSDFDSGVESYVAAMASRSASALSLCKNLLYHMDGMTFEAAVESGVHLNAIARMTDDCKRGVERFLKKS
jgi:methylglutaconyl-CoA hydratase